MNLTAQEEYGLRCLLRVARGDGGAPVTLGAIAEAEGLGKQYVAKLLGVLRDAGLVDASRGSKGGYRLAREARAITLWEALTALGSRLYSHSFCSTHSGAQRECVHTSDCSIRSVWRWIDHALFAGLSRFTLADLLRPEPEMYRRLADHGPRALTGEGSAPEAPAEARALAN